MRSGAGSGGPGDTVPGELNGGAAQAATMAAGGAWSLTLTGLTDGQSYSAVATATDPAGNTASSAPLAFTVDADKGETATLSTTTSSKTHSNIRPRTPKPCRLRSAASIPTTTAR